jgi:uncharacterized repeat protein (TIGR01451 family)
VKKYILLLILFTFLVSAQASAKALLAITIKAEKEVTLNNVTKRVPAETIASGDVIIFTLNYVNSGDEAATNAVINDPIPKGTFYLAGSAFGNGADITFSIDGGKTFKKPSLLTYEIKHPDGKIEKRMVSPEKYTHIRWIIGVVPAKGSGEAGFQVRVK